MNIGKLVALSLGILVVSIGLIFGILYLLTPPAPVEQKTAEVRTTDVPDTFAQVMDIPVDQLLTTVDQPLTTVDQPLTKTVMDSLNRQIERLRNELLARDVVIDSLDKIIDAKELLAVQTQKTIEELKQSSLDNQTRNDNAKTLAKTFETMKTAEISALANTLDDDALTRIYNQMNGRYKKNLLLALSRDRAAQLTNKLMNFASE